MLLKLIELVYKVFQLGLNNLSIIGKLLSLFENLVTVIFENIGTSLPEPLAVVVLSSVFFIVALKIIQFH